MTLDVPVGVLEADKMPRTGASARSVNAANLGQMDKNAALLLELSDETDSEFKAAAADIDVIGQP